MGIPKKPTPDEQCIDRAFAAIRTYQKRLDGRPQVPDYKVVSGGLLLIARVLAYGFEALVLRDKDADPS